MNIPSPEPKVKILHQGKKRVHLFYFPIGKWLMETKGEGEKFLDQTKKSDTKQIKYKCK